MVNLKEDRDIMNAFKRIQETLAYLALCINYSDFMHFREIAAYTIFTYGGSDLTPHLASPSFRIQPLF
jgi:hypothetical protein